MLGSVCENIRINDNTLSPGIKFNTVARVSLLGFLSLGKVVISLGDREAAGK